MRVLLTDEHLGKPDIEQQELGQAGIELIQAPTPDPSTLIACSTGIDAILACVARIPASKHLRHPSNSSAPENPNVIPTPHAAWDTEEAAAESRRKAIQTVITALRGGVPATVIHREGLRQ
jgi:lactate dehydrogenase-like 2-hydroxyacid dehydrogenase